MWLLLCMPFFELICLRIILWQCKTSFSFRKFVLFSPNCVNDLPIETKYRSQLMLVIGARCLVPAVRTTAVCWHLLGSRFGIVIFII
jgi:hypothetical protein